MTKAISQFQTLQTALEASLETAANSLADFAVEFHRVIRRGTRIACVLTRRDIVIGK